MFRFTLKFSLTLLIVLLVAGCTGSTQTGVEPVDSVAESATITPTTAPVSTISESYSCTGESDIPIAECQALVAFYEATGGENWVDRSGWLESTTPCSWVGITCVDGHVDTLALFYNNLQGQLPAALADLGNLRVLDLHYNSIGGAIPAEIGLLTNLEDLELSWNQLEGSIPAGLAGLSMLQRLSLTGNNLSGPIPAEIGQLPNLHTLDLSRNQFTGAIPETLAKLAALQTLRLSDNRLDGTIPFGLGQLPALSEVDLSFNQLSGSAPSALFTVPLHMLWGNQLDGTIFAANGEPQSVNYLGATFTFDTTTADSVWPELVPASQPSQGPGIAWAPPEHIVFTLVHAGGPQNHNQMGLYVPAEAQIQIYPAAGLNEEVQPIVAALQQILSGRPDLAAFETTAPEMDVHDPQLAMLPPSNAQQMFRSQAEYVEFIGGSGIRYLTMLSQGIVPISNADLFYTFQGLTDDGETYVAAYFPVSVPELPDSPQIDEAEFAPLMEDWPGYLAQTAAMLDGQEAASFIPDLADIDALIKTLSVADMVPPPAIEGEGIRPDDGATVDARPVLQWAAVPGAVSYQVVVLDDAAFPPVVVVDQTVDEPQLAMDQPLAPGHYSWTVRAMAEDGSVLAELNRTFVVQEQ